MKIENRKLKSLLFLAFFLLVVLEILTRTYFFISKRDINAFRKDPGRYQGSHFTGYKLSPNFILNHNTLKESINSLGFKSPEIKIKKMENTYRIICIGGSVVYGSFDNEKTWPSFLQRLSNNKKFTEKKVEVINAGIPGYTSFHTLTQFITKIIDLDPDLIISYQLFTDSWYFGDLNKDVLIADYFAPYEKKSLIDIIFDTSHFLVLSRAIAGEYVSITNIFRRKKEIIVADGKKPNKFSENNLYYYERNIRIMALVCEQLGVDLILCIPISLFKETNTKDEQNLMMHYDKKDYYLDFIKEGKNILHDIAKEFSTVYYFDPTSKIDANINILKDQFHPTIAGNELIAKELHKYIHTIKYNQGSLD